MKHLLFLAAIFFALHSNAQTVFAPPNSIWHYGFINSDGESGLFYHKYQMEKDTIFMGSLCSKVNVERHTNSSGIIKLQSQFTYTSNDTVFYYNFTFSKFLPVYIFNVSLGDTLKFHVPYLIGTLPDSFRVIVTSVSNVTLDGITLRQIKTSYIDHFAMDTYTERIGNSNFIGHRPVATTGFSNYLSCYQDGEIDEKFTSEPCDYLKTTNISSVSLNSNLKISPNPFTENLQIDIDPNLKNLRVEMYDFMGRKFIDIKRSEGGKVQLNTSLLINGLYFLKISSTNQEDVIYQKLLKL